MQTIVSQFVAAVEIFQKICSSAILSQQTLLDDDVAVGHAHAFLKVLIREIPSGQDANSH